jgi:hypothetical protein
VSEELQKPDRRRFFASIARWGALGAVGLVAGRLISKDVAAGPLNPDEKCTNRGLCRGCRALESCRALPAELFRQGQEDS